MSLAKDIMELFTSAEALLESAEQTIEVRACSKWLNQAKGSLAQAGELNSIGEVRQHLSNDPKVEDLKVTLDTNPDTPPESQEES